MVAGLLLGQGVEDLVVELDLGAVRAFAGARRRVVDRHRHRATGTALLGKPRPGAHPATVAGLQQHLPVDAVDASRGHRGLELGADLLRHTALRRSASGHRGGCHQGTRKEQHFHPEKPPACEHASLFSCKIERLSRRRTFCITAGIFYFRSGFTQNFFHRFAFCELVN